MPNVPSALLLATLLVTASPPGGQPAGQLAPVVQQSSTATGQQAPATRPPTHAARQQAPAAEPPPAADDDLGLAILAARAGLAEADLWPGFSPTAYPLAVFDGRRTMLAGHPDLPDGFTPVAGHPGVATRPGRHPAVTANSSADLAGVRCATLIVSADDAQPDPARLAAVAAHEAFHVFQDLRHPGWIADESQLFLLPVDDGRLLALRRLESRAWREALLADDGAPEAALALSLRRRREALRSDGATGYERGLELREGLAAYVQHRCPPDGRAELPPAEGWPAEDDRERAYVTGAAMGFLLDRLQPDWRERLEADDGTFLDQLLENALQRRGVEPASFEDAIVATVGAQAEADARAVVAARERRRADFLGAAGPAIVLRVASGPPLSPQGFDPLNVQSLGGRDVLHTRYLLLERPGGDRLEVLGRGVLTTGAGSHPLFGGVAELALTGLPEPPVVTWQGEVVTIKADGLEARFTGATLRELGPILEIELH